MRTTVIVRLATACGGCGTPLAPGATAVELSNRIRSWRAVRCQACAGPAPTTDAASVAVTESGGFAARVSELATRFAKVRSMRDWKDAQAGDKR